MKWTYYGAFGQVSALLSLLQDQCPIITDLNLRLSEDLNLVEKIPMPFIKPLNT